MKIYLIMLFTILAIISSEASYDGSTMGVSNNNIHPMQNPGTLPPLNLPFVNKSSMVGGLTEIKDYATSVGRRFDFRFKDTRAKQLAPFVFNGGNIYTLQKYIKSLGAYSDVVGQNFITIYSTKTTSMYAEKGNTKKLLREIKRLNGVKRVWKKGNDVIFTSTPQGEHDAKVLVSTYNIQKIAYLAKKKADARAKQEALLLAKKRKEAEKIKRAKEKEAKRLARIEREKQIRLAKQKYDPSKTTLYEVVKRINPGVNIMMFVDGDLIIGADGVRIKNEKELNNYLKAKKKKEIQRVYVIDEEKKKRLTYAVNEFEPIILDHPQTIRGVVELISERNGKDYEINFDGNVPVNKNIKIEKLEDLNTYLRRTTGTTIKSHKTKTGVIVVESEKGME